MADSKDLNSKEIVQFGKGLYTDSSPQVQPQGTLRFALNCIDETEEGDMLFPSNMESNIEAGEFSMAPGYTPIGKVYIGEGETVVFLVNEQGDSEIGIYKDKGEYETVLNDAEYISKLNFKITHQIDAVYRLRRGCDKTIYWTDNLNPIRQIILNKPENYLVDGQFQEETLHLFKTWNKIPRFENFTVEEAGNLKAGSYNFAIQYLDSDLNPTEWIIASDTINIYHANLNGQFRDLEGSSNAKNEYQNWGDSTGKSIRLELSNLDRNFDFYRVGIIEATSGSGLVSKVTASSPISTGVETYTFTGTSETVITVEEISQFSNIISTAQSIEQVEGKLLLGNTKGKQINFCELQKYASKILSNYTEDEVIVDQIDKYNLTGVISGEASSKDPLIHHKKLGYMPGEIYSFGIVYYFKDGSSTPAYHIPGNHESYGGDSNMPLNNTLEDRYTDSSKCEDSDYWGRDYKGNILKDTPIRHHRFPTRAEANLGFVKDRVLSEVTKNIYSLTTNIVIPAYEESAPDEEGTINPETYKIIYSGTFGGKDVSHIINLDSRNTEYTHSEIIASVESSTTPTIDNVIIKADIGVTVSLETSNELVTNSNYRHTCKILGIEFSNITVPQLEGDNEIIGYKIVRNNRDENNKTILDSGVLFPISEYKNFLGYGHSVPNLVNANFTVRKDIYAFFNPEFAFNKREYTQNNIEFINAGSFKKVPDRVQGGLSGKKVTVGDRVIENYTQDTYPGTTYDPEVHKGDDDDGLDLHTITRFRDTESEIDNSFGDTLFGGVDSNTNIKDIFYLDALSSKSSYINDNNQDVFNISSDNRIGIVQLESDITSPFIEEIVQSTVRVAKYITGETRFSSTSKYTDRDGYTDEELSRSEILRIEESYIDNFYYRLPMRTYENTPYFYMRRKLSNPYSNFRYLTYYSEHDNIIPIEQTSIKVNNGDAYISPLTYNNSFYHDIKPVKRKTKKSWWKKVLGVLLAVAGIAAFFIPGVGMLAAVGFTLLGAAAGVSMYQSGLEMDKIGRIYNDEYEKGLKYVSRDGTTDKLFVENKGRKQDDDEIQWYNDVINGLWFESQVNIGVRQGTTLGIPAFIPSPYEYMPPSPQTEMGIVGKAIDYSNSYFRRRALEKLTILEPEADDSRLYLGYAIAEYYEVNKDLQRREREKPFFHLGLEYDCCSECVETFPHRVHYSEQSFQEEGVDNYRVFLPNNYVDIPGETGHISNIFRIQNNLYIHTKEAIWNLPKNYQERVTDEIVSFIGTGSYFSVPPQRLIDDESGSSYGTSHKWSRLKTPTAYFFVSESQNAICMFDGKQVKNISKLGTYYWFYNNIPILSDTQHKDNPSNPLGAGFIAVYDSKKELVFFTKKDRLPTGEDTSWTMSFNLKKNSWGSWHSFMPNFYIQTPKNYFSWVHGNNNIWKHNVLGNYQKYYNKLHPYIIEYVLTENAIYNKTFEDITVYSESKKYDPISKTFFDIDEVFFNKLLAYNSKQCTGVLNIVVKDKEDIDFFMNQVSNSDLQNITADRNERNWTINEIRDMVVTKNAPLFISNVIDLQDDYFIDKKLNEGVIDYNKDWTQIESFRDKYLVVRFIFDTFEDIKLITNFTANTEKISIR